MSWLAQYGALARYNAWMNTKLYACAGTLSDAERKRERGAFFKSIHGTLNHLLLGDSAWMARFTGDASVLPRDRAGRAIRIVSLDQVLYADFDELAEKRRALDTRILAWTAGLDEQALCAELRYATTKGVEMAHPLWWALGHFFNHQTHHRGQATTLLSQAGVDVGVTDLIAMLREESEPAERREA